MNSLRKLRRLRRLNKSKSGKITKEEWAAAGLSDGAWRPFDSKNQGFLTLEELQANTYPADIDLNHDGTLTLAELKERKIKPSALVSFLGKHNGVDIASCFDTKYWPLLKECVGLECHFQIKEADKNDTHYINVVDVIYVDGQEYVDAKPVVTGEIE